MQRVAAWWLAALVALPLSLAQAGSLMPRPQQVRQHGAPFENRPRITIETYDASEQAGFLASFLAEHLARAGYSVEDAAPMRVRLHLFGQGAPKEPLPAGVTAFPAMGTEGYALVVQSSGSGAGGSVVIGARTPQGLFYGGMTALQLLVTDDGTREPRLAPQTILDYPDHPVRGAHLVHLALPRVDGRYRLTDEIKRRVDELARWKLNLLNLGDSSLPLTAESWKEGREALSELLAYCRQRHIELVVPVANPASSPLSEYRDGWWLENVPFRFRSVAGTGHVVNPSFEPSSSCEVPHGWIADLVSGAGQWSLDPGHGHTGSSSMRLVLPDHPVSIGAGDSSGGLTLRQQFPTPGPGRYAVSVWVRQQELRESPLQVVLYGLDSTGAVVAEPRSGYGSLGTRPWYRIETAPLQIPASVTQLVVYLRVQEPGHGTVWVDDLHLYPMRLHGARGWIVDYDHRSEIAEPRNPPRNLLATPGMEVDGDGDGSPDGWSLSRANPGEVRWSLDTTVRHCGDRSMRLDVPSPRPGEVRTSSDDVLLTQRIPGPIEPGTYVATLWAKSAELPRSAGQFVFYEDRGEDVGALQTVRIPGESSNWSPYVATIRVRSPAEALVVYARVRDPAQGVLWLDDVEVRRVDGGLQNVLRKGRDIRVESGDGKIRYEERLDYLLLKGPLHHEADLTARPTRLVRRPRGSIPEEARVRVSYDSHLTYSSTSPHYAYNLCAPEVFDEVFRPALDRVVGELGATAIDLGSAEIRGFNRSGACRGAGGNLVESNARLLARFLNAAAAHARTLNPDVEIYVWDDMLSPYHNGGVEDYQISFGGSPGKTGDALGLLDPGLRLRIWWYEPRHVAEMSASVDHFAARKPGYRFTVSPHRDATNIDDWAAVSAGTDASLGLLATTWDGKEGVARVADRAWRSPWRQIRFVGFQDAGGATLAGAARRTTDGRCAAPYVPAPGIPSGGICVGEAGGRVTLDPIPVRDGREYRFLIHARSGVPVPLRVEAGWIPTEGGATVESQTRVVGPARDFERFGVDLVSPADARELELSVVVPAGSPGLALDNFMIRESDPPDPDSSPRTR